MDGEQVPVWHSNTIGFDGNPESMDDLCQSGISNTIGFDGNPGWMESKCKLGFSSTIGFDRKPEAMENCASQSLRPLKGPNTTKQLKKGACR